MTVEISPSILDGDFGRLAEVVARLEEEGADRVHLDVMDGSFVPNISFGLPVVRALRKATRLPLEAHLMVVHPERWVEPFRDVGADLIFGHVEATVHLHRLVHQIIEAGAQAGVALNPATPLSSLEYVLEDLSCVMLMSVNPGFGGQSFIPSTLEKVRSLASTIEGKKLEVDIEVDGGIKVNNAASVAGAGASILVAGSAVMKAPGMGEAIRGLRDEGNRGRKQVTGRGSGW